MRERTKPILKALMALALVAIVGALVGVFADRTLRAADAEVASAETAESCPPEARRHQRHQAGFRQGMAERLDLTPEQQLRMDSLVAERHREVASIRGASRARTDSVMTETRRQVNELLTEAQRETLREMIREHKARQGRETHGEGRPYGETRTDRETTSEATNE